MMCRGPFQSQSLYDSKLTAVLLQTVEQTLFFQALLTETSMENDACTNAIPSPCQQRTVEVRGSSPPISPTPSCESP